MAERRIGVLGATALVGGNLLSLLTQNGQQVMAFSRHAHAAAESGVHWCQLVPASSVRFPRAEPVIEHWICVAPIWVLPDYFDLLEAHGARRIVALSSTSRFTKDDSSDPAEQRIAQRLADAEVQLRTWAESRGMEWVVLRSTLIYGAGRDKNVAEIARFIRRFGFFPLFGQGSGLRQPIHVEDVAAACFAALHAVTTRRAYNISGAETLPYREMVGRVFTAMGRRPRLLALPLWIFRLSLSGLRLLPRFRHWSAAMAERMNRDLVFDHTDAARDFNFRPRSFRLSTEDVFPVKNG